MTNQEKIERANINYQLERIKQLAVNATQGDRTYTPRGNVQGTQAVTVNTGWAEKLLLTVHPIPSTDGGHVADNCENDAEFYAAVTPLVVQELVDVIFYQADEIERLSGLPLTIPPAQNAEEEKYRSRLLLLLGSTEFNLNLE